MRNLQYVVFFSMVACAGLARLRGDDESKNQNRPSGSDRDPTRTARALQDTEHQKFDDDLVAMMDQLAHAAGHQTHPVFVGLHLFRNADQHRLNPAQSVPPGQLPGGRQPR